jgi:hypothetical protein
MTSKSDREKLEVMVGLLNEQLLLIDAQLQAPETTLKDTSSATKTFSELRNLCSLAKDLAAALQRRHWKWPGFRG